MTQKLMPDSQAPELSLPLVGGGTWALADQTPKNFTMVIFYRGFLTRVRQRGASTDAINIFALNLRASYHQ